MRVQWIVNHALLMASLLVILAGVARAADTAPPGWDASTFRDASVIQIMTTGPDVGEH